MPAPEPFKLLPCQDKRSGGVYKVEIHTDEKSREDIINDCGIPAVRSSKMNLASDCIWTKKSLLDPMWSESLTSSVTSR